MVGGEHDEPRVSVVGHFVAGRRERMDPAEVAGLTQVGTQALVELVHHLVGIASELFGAVFSELGDSRLCRVPVAWAVLVEIRGCARQPPQCIPEDRRRFTWHHATELDASVLESKMSGRRRGRRAEIDRARHATARRELAERPGQLAVDPER